jgi:hypothetical protein
MRGSYLFLITLILISSCSSHPVEEKIILETEQTGADIMSEVIIETPTDTPSTTETFTPTITLTPTLTQTPTETLTPTITPTPIPREAFQTLDGIYEDVITNINDFIGRPIKVVAVAFDRSENIYTFWSPNFEESSFAHLKISYNAIMSKEDLDDMYFGWVYGVIAGSYEHKIAITTYERVQIEVIDIEKIEAEFLPKPDGLFMVGEDPAPKRLTSSYIAPGQWKSSLDKTTSGCYWARIADDGRIIANHFGIAGITVRVLETDAVVEFSGCGRMFFAGP